MKFDKPYTINGDIIICPHGQIYDCTAENTVVTFFESKQNFPKKENALELGYVFLHFVQQSVTVEGNISKHSHVIKKLLNEKFCGKNYQIFYERKTFDMPKHLFEFWY